VTSFLARLKMSATFFISPAGILNTSLKALTSSMVTTPSALAILAPSAITPTVNAIWFSASPPSSAPIGPPFANSAVPQIDICEIPQVEAVWKHKEFLGADQAVSQSRKYRLQNNEHFGLAQSGYPFDFVVLCHFPMRHFTLKQLRT